MTAERRGGAVSNKQREQTHTGAGSSQHSEGARTNHGPACGRHDAAALWRCCRWGSRMRRRNRCRGLGRRSCHNSAAGVPARLLEALPRVLRVPRLPVEPARARDARGRDAEALHGRHDAVAPSHVLAPSCPRRATSAPGPPLPPLMLLLLLVRATRVLRRCRRRVRSMRDSRWRRAMHGLRR